MHGGREAQSPEASDAAELARQRPHMVQHEFDRKSQTTAGHGRFPAHRLDEASPPRCSRPDTTSRVGWCPLVPVPIRASPRRPPHRATGVWLPIVGAGKGHVNAKVRSARPAAGDPQKGERNVSAPRGSPKSCRWREPERQTQGIH